MDIKAKPTEYRGAKFRSRLEARWAAFFDLCGWPWEYEPLELNGWSPDFLIRAIRPMLIEVKPIIWASDCDDRYQQAVNDESLLKVWRNVCDDQDNLTHEIIILGNSPGDDWFAPMLGVWAQEEWCQGSDLALIGTTPSGAYDFFAKFGSYQYRISGEHNGDQHLMPAMQKDVDNLWRMAGAATQWKG